MNMKIIAFIMCNLVSMTLSSTIITENYQMWCMGVCDGTDITTESVPGAALQGGVDVAEAFAWQIKNAKGGDFLVLEGSYADYYQVLSVTFLALHLTN
jgi:hypothetical protein